MSNILPTCLPRYQDSSLSLAKSRSLTNRLFSPEILDFSDSYNENAVHGSDSLENAKLETDYFFSDDEIFPRTH